MEIIVKKNKLNFLGHTYNCAIGKNGTTANKIERDGKTPLGCFTFRWVCQAYQAGEGSSIYQKDHLKNLNTQYRYVY